MLHRKAKSLFNLSFHFWPHRKELSSTIDFIKASGLRVLAARSIRDRISHRSWNLKYGDEGDSVHLRTGTEDIIIFEEIFLNNEYCKAANSLPSNCNILDLGGNIGLSCKYFNSKCPSKLIVVVEPDVSNFTLLKRNNADAIRSGRVVAHQCFVAESRGKAAISRRGIQPAGYRMAKQDEVEGMGNGVEFVDCLTIGDLVELHQLDKIDLLKCDIEGAEAELFSNCVGWIGLVKRLVVETHLPYSPEKLLEHLKAANVNVAVRSIVRRGAYAVITADIRPTDDSPPENALDAKALPNA